MKNTDPYRPPPLDLSKPLNGRYRHPYVIIENAGDKPEIAMSFSNKADALEALAILRGDADTHVPSYRYALLLTCDNGEYVTVDS